jgi:hypothetical protein
LIVNDVATPLSALSSVTPPLIDGENFKLPAPDGVNVLGDADTTAEFLYDANDAVLLTAEAVVGKRVKSLPPTVPSSDNAIFVICNGKIANAESGMLGKLTFT